jgi:hypothetical protein
MRLSEFFSALSRVGGDIESFALNLAAPDNMDGDSIDVQIEHIGRIDVDINADEIRFYPASSLPDGAPEQMYSLLGITLTQLPVDTREGDPRLMVELPLLRETPSDPSACLSEICALHIGKESEEAWVLVRPASEYASDTLPT